MNPYLLLLIVHALHIGEEIIGRASFIDGIYKGITLFLLVHIILLLIPLLIYHSFQHNKKWALIAGIIYALIMIIDGITHIAQQEAGIVTGIVFLPIGGWLILEVRKRLIHS